MPEPPSASAHPSPSEIRENFFTDGDPLTNVRATSIRADAIVADSFDRIFSEFNRDHVALIAVGGYGREQLFPYSDVDLLLLVEHTSFIVNYEIQISQLLTALWDSGLRVSHSVRSLSDCVHVAPDNTQLNISLLDVRFLAGEGAGKVRAGCAVAFSLSPTRRGDCRNG